MAGPPVPSYSRLSALLASCTRGIALILLAIGRCHAASIDLSITASVDPPTFIPGGTSTVTVSVHNAGPDTAGVDGRIYAAIDPFDISVADVPFFLKDPVVGCGADAVYLDFVPPTNHIFLVFFLIFPPIPSGQTLTCRYAIEFTADQYKDVASGFELLSSSRTDVDTNPANDRLDFVFRASTAAIPMLTLGGASFLALAIIALAWWAIAGRRVRLPVSGVSKEWVR